MASGHLLVIVLGLGLFLLLLGKGVSQSCPIFGKYGQGLSGSESQFSASDRRIFFNFDAPAQCNGTVTSWQYCYYYDDDDDAIEDYSSSQLFGAYFLVYRRSGSSNTYQPVAGSTKLVYVANRDLRFNSVRCFTETLAANEQFQIQPNDIVAACISDTRTYRELRIVRGSSTSDQDSYQYDVTGYEQCTAQQLQTIDTQNAGFTFRSRHALLLTANINSSTVQCTAGSNPPPFSPSTESGTYLNTNQRVQCTDTITAWHYCYYPSEATSSTTTYTAVIGVWRMNTQYELVAGSSHTLQLQPVSTVAKIVCKSVYLQEADYVRVNQNDVIGVTIPSQNPIPMIATGASSDYSLQRSAAINEASSRLLSSSQLATRSNMALHLYPDIEFVPTTPPPTTATTTVTVPTTAAPTTVETTTPPPTNAAATEATTAAPITMETTSPQTMATTSVPTTVTDVPTTMKATTSPPTTMDATTPPPATTPPSTQVATTEATTTSNSPTIMQPATTSEAVNPETTQDGSNTVETDTSSQPSTSESESIMTTGTEINGQETTVGGNGPGSQGGSQLSIGTLVGAVAATIVVAIIIVLVSVVIVYKWQLCRLTTQKKTGKDDASGIQNVLYDAVGQQVTITNARSPCATMGTVYEEIEPYDRPIQNPSPSTERKKPVQIFKRSGDGYYAAVGPDSVLLDSIEYTLPREVNIDEKKKESLYYSPASEETELYQQIRSQGINQIKKGDIEITGELGTGQFGKVEKGVMMPSKVEVAVKSLKSDASSLDRIKFLQEAAIMAQFNHRNVVTLHGVVRDGNTLLIVLDLLSKGDLVQHLSTLKPDPGQLVPSLMPKTLLSYCQQVALGMVYLAGKGFVHRDLAARNILVSAENTCKIADFGMSRDLAQNDYYVSQGGKVPIKWTAPEAIYFKKYSTASDVWSYGCVLYEIWSFGYKPFKGLRNVEAMKFIDSGRRLSPPPGCPRVIYEIMMQCWNPEASDRPSFKDVLMALLEDEDKVLDIPVRDSSTNPQASVLGAPIVAGTYMYRDIQSIYNMDITAM